MYPFSAEYPSPVSHHEFYVLLVLAHGNAHAYKVKRKVSEFSKGGIAFRDGALYRLMRKMSEEGLIEFAGEKTTGTAGPPRMHYSLGHHGRTALLQELERQKHALAIAESAGLMGEPVPTALDRLLADFEIGPDSA